MESLLSKAVAAAKDSKIAYCKFLSANDTKATNAHQSGYLVSKSAWQMFLEKEPSKGENIKIDITIRWQDDFETDSTFTYYGAKKNEFRLTNFGKNFPYREEDNVGDLFILIKIDHHFFKAFILSHDDEIEDFFSELNISSADTNGIIPRQFQRTSLGSLIECFSAYLKSLKVDFPTTSELALNARLCYSKVFSTDPTTIRDNPDKEILNWLDAEFQLFKIIESERYFQRIQTPFETIEELVNVANTILNRRKSRAGKSLEHHLSEIFKTFEISFTTQKVTEDNKKPDFIFPGLEAYLNSSFDSQKLIMLAAKTTCKDRWRQILNEADRVKIKHLFTLQQGISANQLIEMYKYGVCLVAPKQYIRSFPDSFQNKILSLSDFIKYVQSKQK